MKIEDHIRTLLTEKLNPTYLEVINETAAHHGHRGHAEAGGGGETHFRVVIASGALAGKSRVMQHRAVHEALGDVVKQIHALSIEIK